MLLEDVNGRGRHATEPGPGFTWALGWTVLGAVLPGAGLVAAGRRRVGAAVLGTVALALAALAALARGGGLADRGTALAVDPHRLLALAVVAGAVGVAWAAVIVLTGVQLERRAGLSAGQRRVGAVVVLALVAAVALPAYEVGHYALIQRGVVGSDEVFRGNATAGGVHPRPKAADPWASTPRINVLLIGSDAGPGRWALRPDTMILASIQPRTGNTVLISLPRSLQKARFAPGTPGARAWPHGFDCGSSCLISFIWTWAAAQAGRSYYPGRDGGLHATEDAVEGVTGLKVDTYVMLNLQGFRDFVDAIGRITVNVPRRLPIGGQGTSRSEPYYHQAPGGWIEPGRHQKLNGYHALWFARSRWMYDDYDRMERQRCTIGAIVAKADPTTLAVRFPAIAKALRRNLSTGIATDDLPAWVELARRVKTARVSSLPLTNRAISTVDPDFDQIHRLVRRAVGGSGARPKPTSSTSSTPAPHPRTTTPDPHRAQELAAVC
jgi:polyisoprenyl-teichoic acid--peptidoglycan teichoic acid transferase